MNEKIEIPFSFNELSSIPEFPIKKPSFLSATDNINLAYYSYLPKNPAAIIIFYHGGGLYSNRSYQYIGWSLEKNYNIGSYFFDIRGHGYSQGPRGDSPSIDQVFEDITSALTFVKNIFPNVPIYLVGHSSGAGLLLNYSTYKNKKTDLYSGYILLAPYLGPRVGVERPDAPVFVKKVKIWIYILNQLFKIPIFQHIPAVFFNYPEEILKQDPKIVQTYSYTMSCATTPNNPQQIFETLDKPCALYIGAEDEQFNPEKVVAFAHYNKTEKVVAEIIPGIKHLSILLEAPKLISAAIQILKSRDNEK